MMKALILSDSHGSLGFMCDAVEREKPDVVIHLGDHFRDAEDLSAAFDEPEYYHVAGNCDFGFGAKKSLTIELGGVRMFLTHGHLFGVKHDLDALRRQAELEGARIALFGHTHRAYNQMSGGIRLFNPGACGSYGPLSYGVITLHSGAYSCRIIREEDINNSEEATI